MVAKSPEGIGANVKIFLGHFQKCLTRLFPSKINRHFGLAKENTPDETLSGLPHYVGGMDVE